MATSNPTSATPATSALGRILRTVAWAVLIAFVFGFLIGTLLRRELDRPMRYIGAIDWIEMHEGSGSSEPLLRAAVHPSDIRNTLPRVLMPRDHEEQV